MQTLGSKFLVSIGSIVMALGGVLRHFAGRGGSDLSDFRLGLFFGIGLGLTLLGLWRSRRRDGHRTQTP
jgi:hypothetical protein